MYIYRFKRLVGRRFMSPLEAATADLCHGGNLLKYPFSGGKPQTRYVFYQPEDGGGDEEELGSLYWCDVKQRHKRLQHPNRHIRLHELNESNVVEGGSSRLSRIVLHPKAKPHLSFSLVSSTRSLTLEAPSQEVRDVWLECIRLLIRSRSSRLQQKPNSTSVFAPPAMSSLVLAEVDPKPEPLDTQPTLHSPHSAFTSPVVALAAPSSPPHSSPAPPPFSSASASFHLSVSPLLFQRVSSLLARHLPTLERLPLPADMQRMTAVLVEHQYKQALAGAQAALLQDDRVRDYFATLLVLLNAVYTACLCIRGGWVSLGYSNKKDVAIHILTALLDAFSVPGASVVSCGLHHWNDAAKKTAARRLATFCLGPEEWSHFARHLAVLASQAKRAELMQPPTTNKAQATRPTLLQKVRQAGSRAGQAAVEAADAALRAVGVSDLDTPMKRLADADSQRLLWAIMNNAEEMKAVKWPLQVADGEALHDALQAALFVITEHKHVKEQYDAAVALPPFAPSIPAASAQLFAALTRAAGSSSHLSSTPRSGSDSDAPPYSSLPPPQRVSSAPSSSTPAAHSAEPAAAAAAAAAAEVSSVLVMRDASSSASGGAAMARLETRLEQLQLDKDRLEDELHGTQNVVRKLARETRSAPTAAVDVVAASQANGQMQLFAQIEQDAHPPSRLALLLELLADALQEIAHLRHEVQQLKENDRMREREAWGEVAVIGSYRTTTATATTTVSSHHVDVIRAQLFEQTDKHRAAAVHGAHKKEPSEREDAMSPQQRKIGAFFGQSVDQYRQTLGGGHATQPR